jgi:hypothetical protein
MSAMESYMVNYVCATQGVLLLPFAPAFILINPFSRSLFGFAWSTVLLIFLILAVTPCATDLNCTRIAQPTVTTSIDIISIASTGGNYKRTTYTGASGFASGILKGALITVTGADDAAYNGSFYVTEVTSTTIVVRSFSNSSPESSTDAIISSYINYNSLRDTQKAFSKAILIFYLLFLFFAIWGRLFLCKTQATRKGYLGNIGEGLNKTYTIPDSNSFNSTTITKRDTQTKQEIERIKENDLNKHDLMLQEARNQVEQAKLKAKSLIYSDTYNTKNSIENTRKSQTENEGLLDTVSSIANNAVNSATSFLEEVLLGDSNTTQTTQNVSKTYSSSSTKNSSTKNSNTSYV